MFKYIHHFLQIAKKIDNNFEYSFTLVIFAYTYPALRNTMQNSKYLVANERDAYWGLTVSTVGFDTVEVGESYPTKGHADGYYFDMDKGRELNEYQMLYLLEGEGTFRSAHVEETKIKTGDVFLLFPGEWHTYGPLPHSRWKSYWIGFKGKNMDERVANGFLSVEKPIYRVGFSVEMIELYKNVFVRIMNL